jgi:hypothetical protein
MSDRDFLATGEYVVYPKVDPAEVIETVQVVAEDPTGGDFVSGDDAAEDDAEA